MKAPRSPVLLLVLLSACSGAPAPDATSAASPAATADPSRPLPLPLPEVVARVNGQEIRIQQILPLAKATLDKVPTSERDKRKPEAVRQALDIYVMRELLLQEALARGIAADTRMVERSYDQMRKEHAADDAWAAFLAGLGTDAQALKAELRIQATVSALVAREIESWKVPEAEARALYESDPRAFGPPGAAEPPPFDAVRAEIERGVRQARAQQIQSELVERLRARAKIELYL